MEPFDIGCVEVSRFTGVTSEMTVSGSGVKQLFCKCVSTKDFWGGFVNDWLACNGINIKNLLSLIETVQLTFVQYFKNRIREYIEQILAYYRSK